MHVILLCRSLTTAQRAARVIQREGVFAAVTKAPQSANPGGCTYGVKIAETHTEEALELLERSGIEVLKIIELPYTGAGGLR